MTLCTGLLTKYLARRAGNLVKGVLKPGQCSPGGRAARLSIDCSIRRLRSFDCAGAACATYMCVCGFFFLGAGVGRGVWVYRRRNDGL